MKLGSGWNTPLPSASYKSTTTSISYPESPTSIYSDSTPKATTPPSTLNAYNTQWGSPSDDNGNINYQEENPAATSNIWATSIDQEDVMTAFPLPGSEHPATTSNNIWAPSGVNHTYDSGSFMHFCIAQQRLWNQGKFTENSSTHTLTYYLENAMLQTRIGVLESDLGGLQARNEYLVAQNAGLLSVIYIILGLAQLSTQPFPDLLWEEKHLF